MSNETDRKTVKLESDTHKKLLELSQKTSMSMSVILGYLIDLCSNYEMLEPDWIDKLREKSLLDTKEMVSDDKLERTLTLERARSVTRAKLMAWQKYIECLPVEDRRKYLEQLLGAGGLVPSGQDFIDTLSQWSLVKVNGESRMIRTNPDGTLKLDESLMPCNTGYHIPNAFCKGSCWQTCEIKSRERRQTTLQVSSGVYDKDRRYLESKGIRVDRL